MEARAVKLKSAYEIAKFLMEKIFCRHGPVKVIKSDQELKFTNQIVNQVAKLFNSEFKHSSPKHPQTNGLVERTNQSIVVKLAKNTSEYKCHWDKALPFILIQNRLSLI